MVKGVRRDALTVKESRSGLATDGQVVSPIPEDHPEFDRQWRQALAVAADALSLDEVHDTLESWRRVVWLVSAHGHDGYRRMMAQAQEALRPGQSPPGSVFIMAFSSADPVSTLVNPSSASSSRAILPLCPAT
ncbi:MAG: DUF6247 family protein [Pseudonocardiaceae bacterium]